MARARNDLTHARLRLAPIALLLGGWMALQASAAGASPISVLVLSDVSSESVPAADELDATLTFQVADVGPDLQITLTVSNDTDQAPAGTFDINEVYFNLSPSVAGLTAVGLNGWSFFTDACPVGSSTTGLSPCDDPGGADTKADGFGIFDVALKTTHTNGIDPGSSLDFAFTVAGAAGTMAEAFTSQLSRDTEGGDAILSFAAAKFVEGPQVTCPGGTNICDSAFGANNTGELVPEPALGALVGLGALVAFARRRR